MQFKTRLRIAAELIREQRAIARAARRMPKPVPYEWAEPRLLPLLAGYAFGDPDDEIVRATAAPGCAVEIGMDLGGVFAMVDRPVAERWECTQEQLREVGLRNLRRRLAELPGRAVSSGVYAGRIVRQLQNRGGWAASAVLVPDELVRLFGGQDQAFMAITRDRLVSFPLEAPTQIVIEAVHEMVYGEVRPLFLDPFVLDAGVLRWQPPDGDEEDDDLADASWAWPAS